MLKIRREVWVALCIIAEAYTSGCSELWFGPWGRRTFTDWRRSRA